MKPWRKILIFVSLILFSAFLFFWLKKPKAQLLTLKEIKIKETIIYVEIADSADEKAKGLSGKSSLGKNEGMLFVFAKDTKPTFWMKQMNFPIDIIWINDGKIGQIDKNTPNPPPGTTDSQLSRYTPKDFVDYVLEVNAGFSEENKFEVGDIVDLSSI